MARPTPRRSPESRRDLRARAFGPLRRGTAAFTLVEVLVALAILAVALAAGFRSIAQSADGATALKAHTLALWVAQNRLALAQLETPTPTPGSRTGSADQAGTTFIWNEAIGGTPNPAFRKIEITVADSAAPDYVLARLVGYLGQR